MPDIRLPKKIRQCPACHQHGFQAQRAGLGGSWGGQGIRFLYVCSFCDHREVIESEATRRSVALSGIVLVLLGLGLSALLDAPGNGIVAFLLIGLGGFAIWTGYFAFDRRAPVVGLVKGEKPPVPIEETLYASAQEAAKGALRNRQVIYFVYGIAVLTLFYCLYELIMLT
nr:hypothetical protein [uncultured Cohaesibacter sp.]